MAKNLSQADEGAAADEVAEAVINGLEAVHIEKNDAERAAGAAGTIKLGFDDGDEAAVVRKTGQRIADGQRSDLVEKACLVDQGAREHDGVARDLGEFGEEERAVEEPLREHGG